MYRVHILYILCTKTRFPCTRTRTWCHCGAIGRPNQFASGSYNIVCMDLATCDSPPPPPPLFKTPTRFTGYPIVAESQKTPVIYALKIFFGDLFPRKEKKISRGYLQRPSYDDRNPACLCLPSHTSFPSLHPAAFLSCGPSRTRFNPLRLLLEHK